MTDQDWLALCELVDRAPKSLAERLWWEAIKQAMAAMVEQSQAEQQAKEGEQSH